MAIDRMKVARKQKEATTVAAGKKRKAEESLGSGHEWVRGNKIGEGGFGSVFVVVTRRAYRKASHLPEAMAMKSAKLRDSNSIQYELQVYQNMVNMQGGSCRYIIDHYGEEITYTNKGEAVYNLALQIAWGSLSRYIECVGHGLPEPEVRRYTRHILEGVNYMHKCGYVHCDLKPQNILLVELEDDRRHDGLVAKVADLGLAKKMGQNKGDGCGGTEMYLAPETVSCNEQKEPSDIWAVGCVVIEMLAGVGYGSESDVTPYFVDGVVECRIPDTISSLARDFLGCCLETWEHARFTSEELLAHPFVADMV